MVKILAIDDKNYCLTVLKNLLSDAFPNAKIFLARTGQKGIELCINEMPDVILLDLVMPGMDGFEVCVRLKKDLHLKHIPIIILTAVKSDKKSRIKAIELGADVFLTKPINEVELTTQVNAMLRIKKSEDLVHNESEKISRIVLKRTQKLEIELSERKRTEEELRSALVKLEVSKKASLNLMENLQAEIEMLKKTEAIIKQKKIFSEMLIESLPGIFFMVDSNLNFIKWNRNNRDFLNLSSEEMKKSRILDYISDCEKEKLISAFKKAMTEGEASEEIRLIKFNGKEFPYYLTGKRFDTQEGPALIGVGIDLSKRKESEESLEREQNLIHMLMDNIPDNIYFKDLESHFYQINPALAHFFNLNNPEEAIGKTDFDFFDEEHARHTYEDEQEIIQSGKPLVAKEEKETWPDGRIGWTSTTKMPLRGLDGQIIGTFGISRDITESKKAEELLYKSEQQFRAIWENSLDGMRLIDSSGRIIMVNNAYSHMVKMEKEKLIGEMFSVVFSRNEWERALRSFQKRVSEDNLERYFESEMVLWDETRKWIEVSNSKIENPGSKPLIVSIFRDITERKEDENEREVTIEILHIINSSTNKKDLIRKTISFIRKWLNCDAVGIRLHEGDDYPYFITLGFEDGFVEAERYLCDYDYNGKVKRNSFGNPLLECMCGNIICGRFDSSKSFFTQHGSFWSNCTTKLLASTTEADRLARTRNRCNGEGYESVGLFPIRKGEITFGLLQVNHKQINLFTPRLLSILERFCDSLAVSLLQYQTFESLESKTQELEVSKSQLDLALQSAGMGVWYFDIISNKRHFDKQVCYLLGIDHKTFAGTPDEFFNRIHPDDREKIKESLKRTIEKNVLYEPEYRVVWQDGTIHDIAARARLVRDETGKPWRINGIIWDITDWKRAEQEHLRLQNLESLGILAGGIAHDFNNILGVILGRTSLALDDIKEESIRVEIIEVEKATRRAVGLTRQLLTFAKGGTPEKCAIDLRKIIQDTSRFCLSGSNVISKYDFKETFKIEADPGQTSQVIQNLVINAKQAMPDGGEVKISTGDYINSEQNPFIRIIIQDEGCGISNDKITKIFDPYFTTKSSGSGLGLSVCHSIIKRHGGSISVDSIVNKGTTFTILLPASKEVIGKEEIDAPLVEKKLSILIMDDEEQIREMLSSLLVKLGHIITISKEGNEAVELYKKTKESGNPFDLVFMDLTIKGGMGGKEAVKRLREYDPKAKVIVSSGYADSSVAGYEEDGFNGALKKPYTKKELNRVIFETLKS